MTDPLFFYSEPKPSCPIGATIFSRTHISDQPWILAGPMFYLITSGSRRGYDSSIRNKVRVRPHGLDDGSCGKYSQQPIQLEVFFSGLVQGCPIEVIDDNPFS